MRKLYTALATLALGSALINSNLLAKADTRQVRCDFYPTGEDQASDYGLCSFSQRQGYITIERQNGRRYEFTPVGDQPGNFVDSSGQAVYRQGGLGDEGVIFRLPEESIYIYWDSAPFDQNQESANPDV